MVKPENRISNVIVGAAIEVHRRLGGPGLLESVYEEALAYELMLAGCSVEKEKEVPIRYKGRTLGDPLRLDLRVDQLVIVECKAVAEYNKIFEVQALTYLRLTKLKLGLVINFGAQYVKKGVHRVVNGLQEPLCAFASRRLCVENPMAAIESSAAFDFTLAPLPLSAFALKIQGDRSRAPRNPC